MDSDLSQTPFPCYYSLLIIFKSNTIGESLVLAARSYLWSLPPSIPLSSHSAFLLSLYSKILPILQLLLG